MLARTDQVASVRDATPAKIAEITEELDRGERALVAFGRLGEFRSAYGRRQDGDGGMVIDAACASALGVAQGDTVWSVAR